MGGRISAGVTPRRFGLYYICAYLSAQHTASSQIYISVCICFHATAYVRFGKLVGIPKLRGLTAKSSSERTHVLSLLYSSLFWFYENLSFPRHRSYRSISLFLFYCSPGSNARVRSLDASDGAFFFRYLLFPEIFIASAIFVNPDDDTESLRSNSRRSCVLKFSFPLRLFIVFYMSRVIKIWKSKR